MGKWPILDKIERDVAYWGPEVKKLGIQVE